MIPVQESLLDSITAALHQLRTGNVPPPVVIPEDLPDNELRQLMTYLNRFLTELAPFDEAMEHLARGDLETGHLLGQMPAVQSLKALRSNLRHLTYKTQQIADGDLEQRVDFMGDFSVAFNRMTQQLKDSYQALERRNDFIRKVFGRYTSDEVVEALLDAPEGLNLGGEKRTVTILMSDLRGFTALSERFEASEVVSLLNHYLSAMVEVIQQSGGTIDEIIGDSILVLFGAPVSTADGPQRAVLCALRMQRAMRAVNDLNFAKGWPPIEMGIALHKGEVVVGNIGSVRRAKYGVVGRTINTTARIESFTVGGQIIVSPDLIDGVGQSLVLGDEIDIHAKGMKEVLRCRYLLGHEEYPELGIEAEEPCMPLPTPVLVHFVRLTGKHLDEQLEPAHFTALTQRQALLRVPTPLPLYCNLLLRLEKVGSDEEVQELYAKVLRSFDEPDPLYLIHFTSVPPSVRPWIDQLTSIGGDATPGDEADLSVGNIH